MSYQLSCVGRHDIKQPVVIIYVTHNLALSHFVVSPGVPLQNATSTSSKAGFPSVCVYTTVWERTGSVAVTGRSSE